MNYSAARGTLNTQKICSQYGIDSDFLLISAEMWDLFDKRGYPASVI